MSLIPIGLQCATAVFKKNIGKGSETLPFDWMFATSKFVYQMLILLLVENMNIEQLVREHFFKCDGKAGYVLNEHYTTGSGSALYNSKYDAIFPHDQNNEDNIVKYIRRFTRLKNLILNSSNHLYFIYISQSSLGSGNFTIDGREIVADVYLYLSNIYELIGKYRNNYEMIVFDAINTKCSIDSSKDNIHKDIILHSIKPANCWQELMKEMQNFSINFV